jgi:predicted HTH domain antitoxin
MALTLEIPDTVEQALRLPDIDRKSQLLEALAVALYAQNVLSFGKARELAGLDKYQFGLLLTRKNVPRHYTEEELEEDLEYASGQ